MLVEPSLAALAEIQRAAQNQPTSRIHMLILSAVQAKLADHLIIERCHRYKTPPDAARDTVSSR